jgi:hypothetical protein
MFVSLTVRTDPYVVALIGMSGLRSDLSEVSGRARKKRETKITIAA